MVVIAMGKLVNLPKQEPESLIKQFVYIEGTDNMKRWGHAHAALVRFGDKAVPAIEKAIHNKDPGVALLGVFVLRDIGTIKATAALLSALNDNVVDLNVQKHAVQMLGVLVYLDNNKDKQKIFAALLRTTQTSHNLHVRAAAALELGRIADAKMLTSTEAKEAYKSLQELRRSAATAAQKSIENRESYILISHSLHLIERGMITKQLQLNYVPKLH